MRIKTIPKITHSTLYTISYLCHNYSVEERIIAPLISVIKRGEKNSSMQKRLLGCGSFHLRIKRSKMSIPCSIPKENFSIFGDAHQISTRAKKRENTIMKCSLITMEEKEFPELFHGTEDDNQGWSICLCLGQT